MKKIIHACKLPFTVASVLCVLVFSLYAWIALTGNVDVVIPGKVIRSAQLNPKQLSSVYHSYHIRSIIDLSPGNQLHSAELAFSRKHRIKHIDFGINVHGACSPSRLLNLTHLIETAPKPVLLHCRQGIDRTGLASAVAAIIYNGDMSLIKKQISWRYFDLLPNSTGIATIIPYLTWCHDKKRKPSKETLVEWVRQQ